MRAEQAETAPRARDSASAVVVTGAGVVCSIGHSLGELASALREGRSGLRAIERRSRRAPTVAAPIRDFDWRRPFAAGSGEAAAVARKVLQNAPDSVRFGAAAAAEAFRDAGLTADDRGAAERTGLVVAGSNLSQDYVAHNLAQLAGGASPNPKYAVSYSDTSQVGVCSEILGIRGPGATVGAAAASSHAALFQAFHWLRAGLVERCLVLGASSAFSAVELEAFSILGAASLGADPATACRPFDRGHEGFVWGEAAAAVVLETADSARARGARVRARLAGVSLVLAARHGPEPDADAEVRAMRAALGCAGMRPAEIDYVNAHGTGSPAGDRAECAALREVFGAGASRPVVNSTKSLAGHGMSSAGMVGLLACLVQMEGDFFHANVNLEHPIDDALRFAGRRAEPAQVRAALCNGFGFGGFNAALVLARHPDL